ncbi:hypothetical protein MBLNU457_1511t1 [Dothideomycetes sp. NU457]
MPILSKNGPRLLRMVGNKPHADDSTHEEPRRRRAVTSSPLSSAPSDMPPEEDTYASPKASDDEDMPVDTLKSKTFSTKDNILSNIHGNPAKNTRKVQDVEERTGFKKPKVQDVQEEAEAKKLKLPKSSTLKRKVVSDEDLEDTADPEQPQWMSASQDRKRSQRSQGGYGSSQTYSKKIYAPRKQLKRPKRVKTQEEPSAPKFRRRADFDLHADSSSQPEPTTNTFKRPVFALTSQAPTATPPSSHPINSSPPLTASLPSDSEAEIEEIDMLPSSCPLCGATVDETFKLDWELEHAAGRRMNIKLQERFCQAHREHHAARTWRDRAYPDVDWTNLRTRFRKHNDHLEAIMDGKRHSTFRADLEGRVRANNRGKMKDKIEIAAENDKGSSVGYYGSRGAKLMVEYISSTFAGRLRRLGASDSLIAARGVVGGVSGYVQSVLVPELAVALVMEDCGVDTKEARQILLESADIGEALNAEEVEKVDRGSESPEPEYGLDSVNTQKVMQRLEVLD